MEVIATILWQFLSIQSDICRLMAARYWAAPQPRKPVFLICIRQVLGW